MNLTQIVRGDFDHAGTGTLYHIELSTPSRAIYKIGLTKASVRARYSGGALPDGWTYRVIDEVQNLYGVVAAIEQASLVDNRHAVRLETPFAGATECRARPFQVDWERVAKMSLAEAKALARAAQVRAFL